MNTDGSLDLEALVRELREQAEGVAVALEAVEADGQPVHPVIINQAEWSASLAEAAMGVNASIFEATPDEAGRKRMLELDDALRSHLKVLRKVLALPRRQG